MKWSRPQVDTVGRFSFGDCEAHLADATTFDWPDKCDVLIFDPPWDKKELWQMPVPSHANALVFCDGKYASTAIDRFGPPWWIFVWDTMSTWSTSPNHPLNGCKLCLMYGEPKFRRDSALYGHAPEAKDHPSTSYTPLAGRRLSDLFRKSLRWQSNGSASGASSKPPHTKPDEWVCALVAGVAVKGGLVIDPFMGGGSSLVAADKSEMRCVATEIDRDVFSWAESRLKTEMPLFEVRETA